MRILYIIFLNLFLGVVFPIKTFAQTDSLNQFINIVNPIRISLHNKNPGVSLQAQYFEIRKRNLSATWLLTYDAILEKNISSFAQTMDINQELGIFMEVSPGFAKDAGIEYSKTDSWHRAKAVFLSGYTQEDRRKLIDTVFEKFKSIFGYYPVSVGAWWIDSYSLEYMQKKYKIVANLTCADQFSTDGYQLWGQYFGIPFYPSKFHTGIPAVSINNKLDVVTVQWAPRDPLNGYGRGPASLYSTQDYFTLNLGEDYFQKLVGFYSQKGNNFFGQVTVGLEGDLTPEAYSNQFAGQLDIVASFKKQGSAQVVTMKEFANWYRNNFLGVSPAQILEADDFLGKKIKTIWYQSPALRAYLIYNYETQETKMLDLRFYYDNFAEPYYISPNRDLDLSINIPSVIDSAGNEVESWIILKQKLNQVRAEKEEAILEYSDGAWIKFTKDEIMISGKINQLPKTIANAPAVKTRKSSNSITISSQTSWIFSQEGLIFEDLTPGATNFLKQRKVIAIEVLILFVFLIALYKKYRLLSVIILVSALWGGSYWYKLNTKQYFVPQAELEALVRLSSMPGRRVVIFDKVCLQCSFHTKYTPAVFANKRRYIATVSKKDIVYNHTVFTAKTKEEARKELFKLNADYIYVVKFEDYMEQVPFSPGDLNVEEIYSNANAKIWRIKKQ